MHDCATRTTGLRAKNAGLGSSRDYRHSGTFGEAGMIHVDTLRHDHASFFIQMHRDHATERRGLGTARRVWSSQPSHAVPRGWDRRWGAKTPSTCGFRGVSISPSHCPNKIRETRAKMGVGPSNAHFGAYLVILLGTVGRTRKTDVEH